MKGGYVYTVVFTFIISAVFTAVLATTNAAFLPIIDRNEEMAIKRVVLYTLNIEAQDDNEVNHTFQQNVELANMSGTEVYVSYDDARNIRGYAVPIVGPGLWGSIRGYLGVSADLNEIIGLGFTEQHETPGLGGRIEETWYKEQFRGIPLGSGKSILYGTNSGVHLDAVTGATITSNSVLNILNETVQKTLPVLEVAQ